MKPVIIKIKTIILKTNVIVMSIIRKLDKKTVILMRLFKRIIEDKSLSKKTCVVENELPYILNGNLFFSFNYIED